MHSMGCGQLPGCEQAAYLSRSYPGLILLTRSLLWEPSSLLTLLRPLGTSEDGKYGPGGYRCCSPRVNHSKMALASLMDGITASKPSSSSAAVPHKPGKGESQNPHASSPDDPLLFSQPEDTVHLSPSADHADTGPAEPTLTQIMEAIQHSHASLTTHRLH